MTIKNLLLRIHWRFNENALCGLIYHVFCNFPTNQLIKEKCFYVDIISVNVSSETCRKFASETSL